MALGDPVRKYSQLIGYASCDIMPGDHVHTHNVDFRNTAMEYEFSTDLRLMPPAAKQDTFMGFRRENGKVGTRNYIAISHVGQLLRNCRTDDCRLLHT